MSLTRTFVKLYIKGLKPACYVKAESSTKIAGVRHAADLEVAVGVAEIRSRLA